MIKKRKWNILQKLLSDAWNLIITFLQQARIQKIFKDYPQQNLVNFNLIWMKKLDSLKSRQSQKWKMHRSWKTFKFSYSDTNNILSDDFN